MKSVINLLLQNFVEQPLFFRIRNFCVQPVNVPQRCLIKIRQLVKSHGIFKQTGKIPEIGVENHGIGKRFAGDGFVTVFNFGAQKTQLFIIYAGVDFMGKFCICSCCLRFRLRESVRVRLSTTTVRGKANCLRWPGGWCPSCFQWQRRPSAEKAAVC